VKTEHEAELEELFGQIGRLSTQVAWFKKNLASTLTRSERLAMVERVDSDLTLSEQADLLSISR
jgi:putative transposase